ncbi:EamA family transporter RarD [Bacillus sp. FJAT-49732]|uniref:EamA family transporter RarD n=1 Tax=Lederbergia citrisecunda TaxID=2833583 RepID=A0A942TMA1_9BACI|nr:EamA family transporter RarD [Lederbergia citrisecunda]MBS4199988.1 EamA family transporter RarD [Lederbergia citrisecunda]
MANHNREGIIYAVAAYSIWGILPIFWKHIVDVAADEVLANRIFWSFWFMIVLLIFSKKFPLLIKSLKQFQEKPKKLVALAAASILVSGNWFLFIWAVNNDKVVESSLGYYINPLVSIILGIIFLKESLSKIQIISFFLALMGVLILTFSYGKFPWVSFGLAISFGVYGLVKKMIKVDSSIGLALETLVIMPIAFIYLCIQMINGSSALFSGSFLTDILLIASGAITAIPLLFFAKGVQKIPLYLMGFIQYIAPTMMLILGVFLYGEPFGATRLIAFAFIWGALALVTLSSLNWSYVKGRNRKKVA